MLLKWTFDCLGYFAVSSLYVEYWWLSGLNSLALFHLCRKIIYVNVCGFFFYLCRISVLLLLYPPLPPDFYFSMLFAQPVNTIQNEFTSERCAGRSSLQSKNFLWVTVSTSNIHLCCSQTVSSRCLWKMKFAYCRLFSFCEDSGLPSDGPRQFCLRLVFFLCTFTLLK